MKPFDLQKALAGDPVQTRDGRNVEQIVYFDKANKEEECIAAYLDGEIIGCFIDGRFLKNDNPSGFDLFMAPKVREYWVNVNKPRNSGNLWCSSAFSSKEEAEKEMYTYNDDGIATVKIYEEEL